MNTLLNNCKQNITSLSLLVGTTVVGQVMVLYTADWTNTVFSYILLTVNLFPHPTLIEQGL